MSVPLLSGKVFLLITGASQGIGRQIAESFGPLFEDGSLVLLLARNGSGLKGTAEKLPKGLRVETASVDLGVATAGELRSIISKAIGSACVAQFDKAVIVHNAGSCGDVSEKTTEMTDFKVWREYYDLNVFSPVVLNGVFMEVFNDDEKVERLVINITSLCGIQAIKSLGYYCSGKAAREMYFKVFAAENPSVNVLNYAPGPVETDMLRTLQSDLGDAETKKGFIEMRDSGNVLTTEQTVKRLIEVLKLQKYKSGDHVDFYDE